MKHTLLTFLFLAFAASLFAQKTDCDKKTKEVSLGDEHVFNIERIFDHGIKEVIINSINNI